MLSYEHHKLCSSSFAEVIFAYWLDRELEHALANMLSVFVRQLYGTHYHCLFGFPQLLQSSNVIWKHFILLHHRSLATFRASDSAIDLFI